LKTSLKKPKPTETAVQTILCLDLARHCGWAYVNRQCKEHPEIPQVLNCGTIDFGAHSVKRWIILQSEILNLFKTYTPELLIIEENFQFKNVKTTASLNQLRGAVLLLAASRGVKTSFVDNNLAKKKMLGGTQYWDPQALTKTGASGKYVAVTKAMMKDAVTRVLCSCSVLPRDDDAADAIALALTHYQTDIAPIPLARKPSPAPKGRRVRRKGNG
jgi:Holliday junction resolvasome RuvABC endonuclease subunit